MTVDNPESNIVELASGEEEMTLDCLVKLIGKYLVYNLGTLSEQQVALLGNAQANLLDCLALNFVEAHKEMTALFNTNS